MIKLLDHTRRPDVSFSRDGTITITSRVARALKLTRGDSVNIALRDGEYLLHAVPHQSSPGRFEARCYPANKRDRYFRANSARLCRALLDAVGFTGRRAAYAVGEPLEVGCVTYVPIITALPL